MNDVFYRELPLPYGVGGFTIADENGDYNIYVNSLLSGERKAKAYSHELKHIALNHFQSDKTACECEAEVR